MLSMHHLTAAVCSGNGKEVTLNQKYQAAHHQLVASALAVKLAHKD